MDSIQWVEQSRSADRSRSCTAFADTSQPSQLLADNTGGSPFQSWPSLASKFQRYGAHSRWLLRSPILITHCYERSHHSGQWDCQMICPAKSCAHSPIVLTRYLPKPIAHTLAIVQPTSKYTKWMTCGTIRPRRGMDIVSRHVSATQFRCWSGRVVLLSAISVLSSGWRFHRLLRIACGSVFWVDVFGETQFGQICF